MQSTPLSRKILLFPTSRIRQDSPFTWGCSELAIARTAAVRVMQQSWLIAIAIDIVFCLASTKPSCPYGLPVCPHYVWMPYTAITCVLWFGLRPCVLLYLAVPRLTEPLSGLGAKGEIPDAERGGGDGGGGKASTRPPRCHDGNGRTGL